MNKGHSTFSFQNPRSVKLGFLHDSGLCFTVFSCERVKTNYLLCVTLSWKLLLHIYADLKNTVVVLGVAHFFH